ncbi:hypothetical protein C7830_13640 [Pandoraea apista]|nr:hypothetical protein C7830_13640 [Pandoraea apista]
MTLHESTEHRNVMYAFVEEDKVHYVGKTAMPLEGRLYLYRRACLTSSREARCHEQLVARLRQVPSIDIYVFTGEPQPLHGAFSINLIDGLMDSIVHALMPAWNSASFEAAGKATDRQSVRIALMLRASCRDNGFFNIPAGDLNRHFGPNGQRVKIWIGDETEPLASVVNRTSNLSGACRFYGGARLKRWFHGMPAGTYLQLDVLSPDRLHLTHAAEMLEVR